MHDSCTVRGTAARSARQHNNAFKESGVIPQFWKSDEQYDAKRKVAMR